MSPDRQRGRAREALGIGNRGDEQPVWKQAATGIGLVTLGALAAVAVGLLMAAVLSWLF